MSREIVEAGAIVTIVLLNAIIALVQEGRSEAALEALDDLQTPRARVVRDGRLLSVPSRELVVGDLIALSEGDRVPADATVIDEATLKIDESTLTGESLSVTKHAGDRIYSGTLTTHGSARALVDAIGTDTELGRIAGHLRARRRDTPLQRELASLTRALGGIAVAAAALAFALALARRGLSGDALQRTFMASVALAVAAVPEGLATVVTVALARGVGRMAAQGAIIRRLPAVETLGAATVIATDKTGTLTRNRFEVVSTWIPAQMDIARAVCALCNDATLQPDTGDELEIALLRWVGTEEVDRLRAAPRLGVAPFDSVRKLMSVVVALPEDGTLELTKGAPEEVLARCDRSFGENGWKSLNAATAEREAERLAASGLKVLALAARPTTHSEPREEQLALVGLLGLGDPVRPEAADAVREARSAGVRIVMVTGDHAATARAIAREVGIGHEPTMTGSQIDEHGFSPDAASIPIYARTKPEHKLALVSALRRAGDVVAVTGDGVNDAPALHDADIGIAMGRTGTDVAKEASDLVITDDNLATVVTAIREGRGIYDNIRRVVEYLVAANVSEIALVVTALIAFPEFAVPLLPLQLLWINLITDGLPAIALGMLPAGRDVMRRPPRRSGDPLLGGPRLRRLLARGSLLAASGLGVLVLSRYAWGQTWDRSRGVMFVAVALVQLAYALALGSRWGERAGGRRPRLSGWLIGAVGAGLALQVGVVLWAPTRELLQVPALSVREWLSVVTAATLPVIGLSVVWARASKAGRPS